MQEFIEKLIERLKRGVDKECNSMVPKIRLCDAISIVNQLAEEHNNKSVKTNADYIRNMSDEELSNFLVDVETHGYHDCSVSGSLEMLDWLKEEREE